MCCIVYLCIVLGETLVEKNMTGLVWKLKYSFFFFLSKVGIIQKQGYNWSICFG